MGECNLWTRKCGMSFVISIGYISVALVCLVYIATAFITIGKTGKTVNQIIADGTLFAWKAIGLDMQGFWMASVEKGAQLGDRWRFRTLIDDEWCHSPFGGQEFLPWQVWSTMTSLMMTVKMFVPVNYAATRSDKYLPNMRSYITRNTAQPRSS